jgi:hypothetical protein
MSETAPSDDHGRPSLPDGVLDAPVSSRLVYLYVREVGAATVDQLATDLGLSKPPIYDARDRLLDRDLLTVVSDPEDGRRDVFRARSAGDRPPTQLDSSDTPRDERDPRNRRREPSKH